MSTITYAARDSRTMLRRNLRRMARYPSLILFLVGAPIIFLLLSSTSSARPSAPGSVARRAIGRTT